jgi:hypothetical protein
MATSLAAFHLFVKEEVLENEYLTRKLVWDQRVRRRTDGFGLL